MSRKFLYGIVDIVGLEVQVYFEAKSDIDAMRQFRMSIANAKKAGQFVPAEDEIKLYRLGTINRDVSVDPITHQLYPEDADSPSDTIITGVSGSYPVIATVDSDPGDDD